LLLIDDGKVSAAPGAADTFKSNHSVRRSDQSVRRVYLRVPERDVAELRARCRSTRWLTPSRGDSWRRGADIDYLRELVRYWAEDFDWRARERQFNALPNRLARVGSERLHLIHARSPHPEALALVIVHGWPSAPAEFAGIIGRLTDPTRYGASAEDAFHVVIVSLPGFLLSGAPSSPSYDIRDAADTVAELMTLLGYERYGAHGGDWGATVAMWLSHLAPERLVGLHLTTVVAPEPRPPPPLSGTERTDLEAQRRFRDQELAYKRLQATKPDALAVGLGDSPAGLLAWLVDKYRSWSDCDGDVEAVFDRDLLLELCTLYWLTGTIGSSMRLYFDTRASGRMPLANGPVTAPTGCAISPHDLVRPPRQWAEAWYRIERWTKFDSGGHFPALERPSSLVEELRALFGPLR
jgi:microsomal epoxide hydrolase